MALINLLGSAWPQGDFWSTIIKLFDFVGDYAWTIILFTICLKLVLSPMDFLQKFYTNKTSRAQAKLAPQLEKLKKQYGQNQTLLYQKQNELYKRNNFSMKGSCVVMLVYLALTLVIFITLFNAMQYIAGFKIKNQYQTLQTTYNESYEVDNNTYLTDYLGIDLESTAYLEATNKEEYISSKEDEKATSLVNAEINLEQAKALVSAEKLKSVSNAQDKVFDEYLKIKDSWLWVKNIWRADKATNTAILDYAAYCKYDTSVSEATYNTVMGKLLDSSNGENGANGYYILSIIVLAVSFLSQWLTRRLTAQKGPDGKPVKQQGAMKIMMYILPVTMVIFTLNSSAIFSIYIIINSVMSTLLTPLTTIISNKIEDKADKKKKEAIKVDYRR